MGSLTTIALTFSCIIALVYSQSPHVTTPLGNVTGKTILFSEDSYIGVNKYIDVYKGIPYAEPPVGDLRFEKPLPKEPWSGTLNATKYSSWCIQSGVHYTVVGEDDCLYLNIFVPQTKPRNAAVMFFIHGGGFVTGTASTDDYSGVVLAATGDVIVVTINYRLNFYGFLTTGDDDYPGNIGLFDQLEALKWVNKNIGAFGGDPSRVTIFGESAGSASVDYHLLSKESWDYFSQAILESGTTLSNWAYTERDEAKDLAIMIGTKVGCEFTDSKAFVECMKGVDPGAIANASVGITVYPAPVVDGIFIKSSPEILIRNGDFKTEATIIVGTNKDEGTLAYLVLPDYQKPSTPNVSKSEFLNLIPTAFVPIKEASNPHILDAIYFEYTDWSQSDDPEASYFNSGVRLATDFQFLCPSDAVQRAHFSVGNKVFVYLMTHIPKVSVFDAYNEYALPWIGAGHGEELQFVFGYPFLNGSFTYSLEQPSDTDRNVSVEFMRYWTNFAKTGDPNTRGNETSHHSFDKDLAVWPEFTIPELNYIDINPTSSSERAYRADKCAFWSTYEPKLEQFAADMSESEELWRNDYYNWKYNDLPEWQKAFDDYKENKVCT
ncbi:cholinesterase 2-like [Anneissia japonica]|uniref:cholinesterase 2-like n=1 Tax=Anneissia japonica TaxID=1529436 RepID=UPI001425B602|nr:cholinesterase 2-like [Anneissia japonica]